MCTRPQRFLYKITSVFSMKIIDNCYQGVSGFPGLCGFFFVASFGCAVGGGGADGAVTLVDGGTDEATKGDAEEDEELFVSLVS